MLITLALAGGCAVVESSAANDTTSATANPVLTSAEPRGATTAATTAATTTATPPATSPATSAATTSSPSSSTTTTTTPSTSSTAGASPMAPATTVVPALEAALGGLIADRLGISVNAVSISVRRQGSAPFDRAVGTRRDGQPVNPDTPFVMASVGKLLTGLTVARLARLGLIDVSAPVPWGAMGLPRHPSWDDVTVRELLDHSSGMPTNSKEWLDDPAPCSVPLAAAMAAPPSETRGIWRYSNGNYCALGLLIEHVTSQPLDAATDALVLAPAGVVGPYLARFGDRPDSAPYVKGTARLLRLGGAGEWIASTADIASVLMTVTDEDRATLRWPGIFQDQYGWGHTGTLDGAKACAWVFEGDGTVMVAVVSGEYPRTGGKVCDQLVPALASDLGLWAGEPVRVPR